MVDAVTYAIPFFLLFIAVEAVSFRYSPDGDQRGYDAKDSITSLTMGAGYSVVMFFWKFLTVVVFAGAFTLSPLELSPTNPLTWILLVVLDDFFYYWYHRTHHRVRVLWASHVVHHSSEYFNFTTALRQPWTALTSAPFWIPLALVGIPPWMILLQQSLNLIYQFFIHTERVQFLPRPIEFLFNTPSHHRAHHGSDPRYLDCNYGGVFIVWDRVFGSFVPETTAVTYGLTSNIKTFNPVKVAFHEYASIGRDVSHAPRWRDKLGYVFGPPGWSPTESAEHDTVASG
ncbi:sterol desaturase family protein [Haloglycomyces albus]|uniref:sterol desaturase family protein n=1 Tax=Haloglycomyces albus TaxID=526067 RepID=UPI00046CFEC6|nr:sterol desaturase family protein [Haloglycomyces albus]